VLFRRHQPAFQTQYAEVRERARAAGRLLPGTPGSLALRAGTGHSYWYRVYYFPPGKQREDLVCKDGDEVALRTMRERIEFSDWMAQQVPTLRKLGFQVADKLTARVLVELHNTGALQAGLVLVGTLAYMAWLNEFGVAVVAARTMDIDLARSDRLALGAPMSFLDTLKSTGLPFSAVPGLTPGDLTTSMKLPGVEGLRVDLLTPGVVLGAPVSIPELSWVAQAVPHYDYLLADPAEAVVLAGWQCIPVRIPQAARFVWHKLYSSVKRREVAKRAKDFQQATLLAAVVNDSEPVALHRACDAAPEAMIAPVRQLLPRLKAELVQHPEAAAVFESCLSVKPQAKRTRTRHSAARRK
jgi:hypothetical protein